MDNKSISHTRRKCQYHIVFIPKYRKKVLYDKIRDNVREIISTLCQYKNVAILPQATVNEAKIGDFCIWAQNSLVHSGAEAGNYSHIDSDGIVTKGKKVPEATKVEIREVY